MGYYITSYEVINEAKKLCEKFIRDTEIDNNVCFNIFEIYKDCEELIKLIEGYEKERSL